MDSKQLNGFKLKAYTNLYKKGKNFDVDKLPKEERKSINREEMYKKVYFKTKTNKKSEKNENLYHPWLADHGIDNE